MGYPVIDDSLSDQLRPMGRPMEDHGPITFLFTHHQPKEKGRRNRSPSALREENVTASSPHSKALLALELEIQFCDEARGVRGIFIGIVVGKLG